MRVSRKKNVVSRFLSFVYNSFWFVYRWDVLANLINRNDYKRFVEVGVWKGENIAHLLKLCPKIKEVVGVDPYKLFRDSSEMGGVGGGMTQEMLDNIYCRVDRLFCLGNLHSRDKELMLIREDSLVASRRFVDGSVDMVFLDAQKTYEACLGDIEAWFPKVRVGGVMSGHDYNVMHFSVVRAVNCFFGSDSVNVDHDGVWWVKKR